jgi:hypothetical protein
MCGAGAIDADIVHCERSEAIQTTHATGKTGLLRRYAPRNDRYNRLRNLWKTDG